jgi:hypothetical protein
MSAFALKSCLAALSASAWKRSHEFETAKAFNQAKEEGRAV